MDKIIGIGDYAISNDPADVLKTFALASCVAITVYNPILHLAGMVHIALPFPANQEEAELRPWYYAASGIPLLIDKMTWEFGSRRENLQVKLFGGAESQNSEDYFKIGSRNVKAAQEIISRMDLRIAKAQTGGTLSRSITMSVQTGEIEMTTLPIIC
jgi:chemotaxis protein CheD